MEKRVKEEVMLKVLSTLNEAQSRWHVAKEAISLGRGGLLKRMYELTGLSRPTILKGMKELKSGQDLSKIAEGKIRKEA
jgi:butyrate kinase